VRRGRRHLNGKERPLPAETTITTLALAVEVTERERAGKAVAETRVAVQVDLVCTPR